MWGIISEGQQGLDLLIGYQSSSFSTFFKEDHPEGALVRTILAGKKFRKVVVILLVTH
jgi:hypothetical protein